MTRTERWNTLLTRPGRSSNPGAIDQWPTALPVGPWRDPSRIAMKPIILSSEIYLSWRSQTTDLYNRCQPAHVTLAWYYESVYGTRTPLRGRRWEVIYVTFRVRPILGVSQYRMINNIWLIDINQFFLKNPRDPKRPSVWTDWLTGWLTDWLTDWLTGWLADWLPDSLTYSPHFHPSTTANSVGVYSYRIR